MVGKLYMRVVLDKLKEVVVWIHLLQFRLNGINLSLQCCEFVFTLPPIFIHHILVIFLHLPVIEVVILNFPQKTGIA